MRIRSISKSKLLCSVILNVLVGSSFVHAARVVSCKQADKSHDQLCILRQDENDAVKLGSQVVVFKQGASWSATGSIIKVKGYYSLGTFHEFIKMPRKGLYAIIKEPGSEHQLDWDQSFSRSESELNRDKS